MFQISVVVPTFERRESLARLLDALSAQTLIGDFEVLVVDDGSRDGTMDWLRSLERPYPLRALAQAHAGPAAARNRGVEQATGDLIVFLDDDVVPEPDLIAAHVAAHGQHPGVVVCGPMLPPRDSHPPVWIRWEEEKLVRQYRALQERQYECTYRQFFTGNASLARDRFISAGGFDTAFVRAEDVELGFRLHRLGMTFVFDPGARVHHYPRRTFAAWQLAAYRYGQADVVMSREKGSPQLDVALAELHRRHWLSKTVVGLCVGRSALSRTASAGLGWLARAADSLRLRRLALTALSGLYTVQYWQGVSDALGGRGPVSRAIAMRAAPAIGRSVQ